MAAGSTQGEKKIRLQLERLVETNSFQSKVIQIRRALGLPEEGVKPTKDELRNLSNPWKFPSMIEGRIYDGFSGYTGQCAKYAAETKALYDSLPVQGSRVSTFLRGIIFYDHVHFPDQDMGEVHDAEAELAEYGLAEDSGVIPQNERIASKLWAYPVAVRIHADASQRDVVAFIKNNWKEISTHQKKYVDPKRAVSLKNSKTRIAKKERDAFIYENKHLTHKKIVALVRERPEGAEHLDVGSIGKIISLESKRRKV